MSAPHLWDPGFRRSVVFILDHSEFGAMGLILNQPTDIPAVGILPDWDPLVVEPPVVFRGGAVQLETAIGLARRAESSEVGLIDLSEEPADVLEVRIFAGYSGWGPLQLDGEMEEQAWLEVDPDPTDLLTPEPEHLWEHVVDRLPGSGRLLRTMPTDPGLN